MKRRIPILTVGTHTSTTGNKTTWTRDMVGRVAEVYDTSKYASPLVLGHRTFRIQTESAKPIKNRAVELFERTSLLFRCSVAFNPHCPGERLL